MKLAMVILYLYSLKGGPIAHEHFMTMGECVIAADEARKRVKGTNLELVCIPQQPDE